MYLNLVTMEIVKNLITEVSLTKGDLRGKAMKQLGG